MSQRTAQRQSNRPRQNSHNTPGAPRAPGRSGTHKLALPDNLSEIVAGVVKALQSGEVDTGASPENDYSDTERVQVELLALLDLLGVVRRSDIQEHVFQADGNPMTDSNVRYHMKKLANRGLVKKVEERYKLPGLGWRTRDVWSKDSQKLLEILEGKKIVRS